ncbi:MAG: lipopolysaccharide assembly protein LapA domain-containing protein [Rhodoblastus sp.]
MRTLFRLLVVLPVAIVIVLFAVANRQPVDVSFDPFPGSGIAGPTLTTPLFLLMFIAGGLGVLAGGVAVWLRQGRFRKQARTARNEAVEARGETEHLRAKVDRMERATLAGLPSTERGTFAALPSAERQSSL